MPARTAPAPRAGRRRERADRRRAATDARDELLCILNREINRLPEKYRLPIVLCELEGLTRKEAAGQLDWPPGTVATRLARGQDLLRAAHAAPARRSLRGDFSDSSAASSPLRCPPRVERRRPGQPSPWPARAGPRPDRPRQPLRWHEEFIGPWFWTRVRSRVPPRHEHLRGRVGQLGRIRLVEPAMRIRGQRRSAARSAAPRLHRRPSSRILCRALPMTSE